MIRCWCLCFPFAVLWLSFTFLQGGFLRVVNYIIARIDMCHLFLQVFDSSPLKSLFRVSVTSVSIGLSMLRELLYFSLCKLSSHPFDFHLSRL